jgi:phosphoglycerate dehydrogenase-like enzyme
MTPPFTIWCNAELPDYAAQQLAVGIGEHRLVIDPARSANISAGGPSALLETADVAFGQPDAQQICGLQGLRWVHLTSAGYTRYDREDVRAGLRERGAFLTNSSTVFAEPCAQHLLAFMLAQARQLPQSLVNQLGSHEWSFDRLRPQTRLLSPGQTVALVGYGAIAERLVELLEPFGMNLIGVRRKVRGDEAVQTVTDAELPDVLEAADHVVNNLPANQETDGFFDANRIAQMKLGTIFYNIGRGTTVDQGALMRALDSGRVAAAYLDVVDPEPLPSDHPLWNHPNCWISPHIGGGHAEEFSNLVDHFLNNLRRFEAGEDLVDRII